MNTVPQWGVFCPMTGKEHVKAFCNACGALDPNRPYAFPRNSGQDREHSIMISSSGESSDEEPSSEDPRRQALPTPTANSRSDAGRFAASPRIPVKSNESRKIKKSKLKTKDVLSSKGEANSYRKKAIFKQQDQDEAKQRRHAGRPAIEGLSTDTRALLDWLEPEKPNTQPSSYEAAFWLCHRDLESYSDQHPKVRGIDKISSGESC